MNRFLFGHEHVDRYRATDGEEGHDWLRTQVLLLTTKGRKSGKPRTLPLIHGISGDDYLVVASKGGAPDHPGWYKPPGQLKKLYGSVPHHGYGHRGRGGHHKHHHKDDDD